MEKDPDFQTDVGTSSKQISTPKSKNDSKELEGIESINFQSSAYLCKRIQYFEFVSPFDSKMKYLTMVNLGVSFWPSLIICLFVEIRIQRYYCFCPKILLIQRRLSLLLKHILKH